MKEKLEKREAAVRNHVSRLVGGWLWGLHGNVNNNLQKNPKHQILYAKKAQSVKIIITVHIRRFFSAFVEN
jgi:hypothetical protein